MNESPNFTQLSVPLARQGQNFAPVKPLTELLQTKKLNLKAPTKFEHSFREWYTAKMNHEKSAWDEMASMAQLVSLFRKGQQLLVRRPYGPGYYVRPIQNDDTYRQTAMNLMSFHSQVCESKIIASNPTINMRAGDDTPEAIATAQACRPVVDCYETEWYTAKFSRREAIRLLTDGIVIHQVRWNPFKGGYEVAERQVSRRDVQIDPGEGVCADCQYTGPAEEFPQSEFGNTCPQCQSEAVDMRKPVNESMAQIGMGQPKPVGEPEIITSPFTAWRWDLTKDLECSSWAIKRQRITQGAINLMLGNVTIPDSGSSDDYGLEIIYALAYSGQAFQGQSYQQWRGSAGSTVDKNPTMFEAWLSPEDQAEIECEEGETICGVPMPKGRLSNFFKGEPACVVGLNDAALIIGVYAKESQKQEVVTAHWSMDADSGGGRGLEDTAAVQKRFNAVDGQIYQGLAMGATPSVFIDKSMLKEDDGKYLYRPGQNIDVNLAMLPPNTKLSDAIHIPPINGVNQQFIQYGTVFLRQMGDIASFSVEFSDLLAIDNRTATGAQITAALANSLYGPILMSKGESRVEIAKRIVCLVKNHAVAGRYYPGKGAAQGRLVGGQDLKGKVIFDLVQNSQLPVTPFSQQTDVRVALESLGGVEGFIALDSAKPALLRQLIKPFNLKLESEDADDVSNRCLGRLEQMKQMLAAGVDDPNMLVQMIQPPVSMYEPKHPEKQRWWSDWLDLDSAQEVPLVLRQAAEAMYNLHMNYETQRQMPEAANAGLVAGIGQAAAAAPSALGAAALQQEQPQEQGDDQELEIESEMAMQERELAHEDRQKDKEIAGQLAVTEVQGKNQIENTKVAGANAIKVQKAKPKPKPAAKKVA